MSYDWYWSPVPIYVSLFMNGFVVLISDCSYFTFEELSLSQVINDWAKRMKAWKAPVSSIWPPLHTRYYEDLLPVTVRTRFPRYHYAFVSQTGYTEWNWLFYSTQKRGWWLEIFTGEIIMVPRQFWKFISENLISSK